METIAPTVLKQRLDPYTKFLKNHYVNICVYVYVYVDVHVHVDIHVYVDVYVDIDHNWTYITLIIVGVETVPFVSNYRG